MKDAALLLLMGSGLALLSWAFWHFLGSNAFEAFTLAVMILLGADNFRLRKMLKKLQASD